MGRYQVQVAVPFLHLDHWLEFEPELFYRVERPTVTLVFSDALLVPELQVVVQLALDFSLQRHHLRLQLLFALLR